MDEKFHDKWRVFGRNYDKDADHLPRKTSIQRAYADHLKQGGKVRTGYGIFFFDEGETDFEVMESDNRKRAYKRNGYAAYYPVPENEISRERSGQAAVGFVWDSARMAQG